MAISHRPWVGNPDRRTPTQQVLHECVTEGLRKLDRAAVTAQVLRTLQQGSSTGRYFVMQLVMTWDWLRDALEARRDESVSALLAAANDSEPVVVRAALQVLVSLAPEHPDTVSRLRRALQDGTPGDMVAHDALLALAQLTPTDLRILEFARTLAADEEARNQGLGVGCLSTLGRTNPDGVTALVDCLRDPHWGTDPYSVEMPPRSSGRFYPRLRAITALARLGARAESALPLLREQRERPDDSSGGDSELRTSVLVALTKAIESIEEAIGEPNTEPSESEATSKDGGSAD
jgi:hypothetical protein